MRTATLVRRGLSRPPTLVSEVLKDNPLLYWPMSETSGTKIFDLSGHQRHGTLVGTATLGSNMGSVGPGINTLGTGYVTGVDFYPLMTNGLTWEAWVIVPSTPTQNDTTIMSDSGYFYAWLATSAKQGGYSFRSGSNGSFSAEATSALTLGVLHQVVYQATPTTNGGTYYLDGEANGIFTPGGSGSTFVEPAPGVPFSVGADADNTRHFNMQVSHVQAYDTILSADRIRAHYIAGTHGS